MLKKEEFVLDWVLERLKTDKKIQYAHEFIALLMIENPPMFKLIYGLCYTMSGNMRD